MPTLYTVFFSADSSYWSVTNILYSIREILHEKNITYNPRTTFDNQVPSHYYFGRSLHDFFLYKNSTNFTHLKNINKKINAYFQNLNDDAASGSDVICSIGAPHFCIPDLYFSYLKNYSHLKNINHKVILIISRQDLELYSLMFSTWKRLDVSANFDSIVNISSSHKIDEFYSSITQYCHDEDIEVLINNSKDPFLSDISIQKKFIKYLQLQDANLVRDFDIVIPQSVPSLDIYRATYHFPFHVKRINIPDRKSLFHTIGHVEQNEGFQKFNAISKKYSQRLLEMCEPANRRLAKLLGLKKLFVEPHPLDSIPDLPVELPSITPEQCRCFVSAFTPEFRSALLRYFKDIPCTLHPSEFTLAKSLEEYVPKHLYIVTHEKPLLTVLTLCKNHEKYIQQCLESVATQETTFPIEHIVVDAYSSDDSASIIENYASHNPHIHPVYLSNLASINNITTLLSLCHSKYAALCDGDDFFTNPLKLQKQVDFLEAHSECSICFHPVKVQFEDGTPSRYYPPEEMLPGGIRLFYTIKDLLQGNMMQTSSVVYRWRFSEGLPKWFIPNLRQADWYWHLLHAEVGLIGFINERMSVYRRHAGAVYVDADKGHLEHRRMNGLAELKMYKICNEHFKNRFYRDFYMLAAGVLADFLYIYATTGDDKLLQAGLEICPYFGRDFLANVKVS